MPSPCQSLRHPMLVHHRPPEHVSHGVGDVKHTSNDCEALPVPTRCKGACYLKWPPHTIHLEGAMKPLQPSDDIDPVRLRNWCGALHGLLSASAVKMESKCRSTSLDRPQVDRSRMIVRNVDGKDALAVEDAAGFSSYPPSTHTKSCFSVLPAALDILKNLPVLQ